MALCSERMFVLSLCSGICGLDLGVKIARPDTRVICYVERKKFAVDILQQRMREGWLDDAQFGMTCKPSTPNLGVDSWIASLRGIHVKDSVLPPGDGTPHLISVEKSSGSSILVNQESSLSKTYHARKSLAKIRQVLTEMGFDCPPLLEARASDVGAPHQRKRLFLFGYSNGYRKPRLQIHAEMEGMPVTDYSLWEDYTGVIRMANGISARMDRLDASGNAVMPLVAAYAWRTLENSLYAKR